MILFFSLLFSDFSSVQSMLDKQEASGHVVDEHLKDQMAAVHSQVWLNYGFFWEFFYSCNKITKTWIQIFR